VQVTDVAATDCSRHREVTMTRATLGGRFFRAARKSPVNGKTDVIATIRLGHRLDSTTPPDVLASYTVSDSAPPGVQFKRLGAVHFVPDCSARPRPMAFTETWFADMMVNESAPPHAQRYVNKKR